MTSDSTTRRTDRRLRVATWIAGLCFVLAPLALVQAFGMAWAVQFATPAVKAAQERWIVAFTILGFALAAGGPTWIVLIVVRLWRWSGRSGVPPVRPRFTS